MGDTHTTLVLWKGLAERLFTLAEREGLSVEEFLSRALEPYTGKPRSATEVLEFVKRQTGRTPIDSTFDGVFSCISAVNVAELGYVLERVTEDKDFAQNCMPAVCYEMPIDVLPFILGVYEYTRSLESG
jgi:hypothetical protein